MTSRPFACGHAGRGVAFVDETARGRTYGLCAAMACRCELPQIRRIARGFVRPGQRRLHLSKERERRRKELLSAICRSRVQALFVTANAKPVEARSICWHALVPDLVALRVGELRIEAVDGAEDRDRRDIRDALAAKGLLGRLDYRHQEPATEPMLWIADAVAWAAGAGGPWRSRLGDVLLSGT